MNSNLVFLVTFGIGLIAGLRSMTGPALAGWAAHLGWLNLQHSRLAFMGSTGARYSFSALALGELIADKLPFIPNRTSPPALFARLVLGGLSGAMLCAAASRSATAGATLGGAGAVVGAFAGYQARTGLVKKSQMHDFVVALLEDLIAVGCGLFFVSRF
jgi:uncharacterized membrane protein